MPEPRYNRFDFQVNPRQRILYVRARGNWELPLTRKFGAALHEQLSAINRDDALWFAKQHGSSKQAVVAKIPGIPLQTEILVQRVGMQSIGYFRTEQDAAQ